MSYAVSAALQAAIYDHLRGDAGVAAHAGAAIFDAMPPGDVPAIYVVLGDETVRDASDQSGPGAVHDLTISVVTSQAGFAAAKSAAGAVAEALEDAPLDLARGRLIAFGFAKARALRSAKGALRRIDMTFRARTSGA